MPYSPVANKTREMLTAELQHVFETYPEYSEPSRGPDAFNAMVQKFAADDFYHLHLVARAYLGAPVQFPYVGQRVTDRTGDFDMGRILDIYTNTVYGPEPVQMLIVDFGDDQVFDRLLSEVSPVGVA